MSKKHSIRRSAAGIFAVLTVTGNMIAPAQFGITWAPAAIEAEAATIDNSSRWNTEGIAWDASTGTLTIKKGITNAEGAVNQDHPDQIDGSIYSSFFSRVAYKDVKHIVIAEGATMPKSWYHLFQNFTNLESIVIKASVDAANVYDFGWAFAGLTKLTDVDLSGLTNVTTVDYIENMFNGCSSLKVVDLSMLSGENAGMREWSKHQAIDHIKKAIAGCNQIEDLNLTGEYLYNLVENIKSLQGSSIGDIDNILGELLAGNTSPHIEEIRARLKQRYLDYKAAVEDEMQWKPYQWNWTETETGFTCTVDVRKKVRKENGHGFEYKYETGKVCEITSSVVTVPTCEQDGVRTFIAKWTNTETEIPASFTCDDTTHVKPEPAYGHSFEGASCEWAEDYSSADFVEVCSRCDEERRTAAVVSCEHFDATCTEAEYAVYTAVCNGMKDIVTVNDISPALGHQFTVPAWEWNGYSSAVLTLSCAREGCSASTEITEVTITSEITTAPSCTETGIRTYTATAVYNGVTYTDEKEEVVPATEHTPGEAVRENINDSTCAAEGSYESVVYCSECNAEISRETVTIPKKDHTPAEAVRENVNDSTCAAEGSYDSVVYCSECNVEISRETVTIPKKDHTPAEAVRENVNDSTCAAEGSYDSVVYCSECNAEISRETIVIPKKDHTPAEAVRENVNDSTCAAEGSYESVVYCSECNAEISRETVTIPKKDHTYGDLAWRWAEDYQSAELVSKCQNEGCEEENAYAADVILDTADIRYIEANDVHGGVDVYKASVIVNGETYVDEQLVDTEKLSDVITAATRTLQLEGRVVVNWYAKFCDDITQPQMQIVDEGGNVLRTVDGVYVTKGNYAGRYLFSYNVAAKEMSDETFVKFIGVRDNETVSTVKSYGYSVRTYCENKLADESASAALKELCAAMLTYGASAQTYFGYQEENLADANLDELYGSDYTIDKSVIESSTAKGQRVAFDGATVAIKNPSLLLESGTTVRFYTNLTAETAEGTFLAYRAAETDEFSYAPIKCITSDNGTFYVGEIENIVAKDLTNLYEVYICTADENGSYTQVSDTLFYGPEAYAVSKYTKSDTQDALKELVAAMMDYCAKAKAFFGSQNG